MTLYPTGIDNNYSLPPATGDDAISVNAAIEAIEAIETELGIVPSGVYADVRARLDILEARINNPFAPSPDVSNPFYIGNTGVTIQAGFGDPNVTLSVPPHTGSVFLQEDGYGGANVYSYGIDEDWVIIGQGAIVGSGTNEFTGVGTSIDILATESVLGATTTNSVKGSVGGITTTDGTTWTDIFDFTPVGNTGNDWLVSLIGLDVTSNPISGNFYRADLQFTTITVSGSPPVLYPGTPAPLNIQSNGGGTYAIQVIISGSSVVIQVLGNASTTVDWSGSLQNMSVS
jgi:hypothetical protein